MKIILILAATAAFSFAADDAAKPVALNDTQVLKVENVRLKAQVAALEKQLAETSATLKQIQDAQAQQQEQATLFSEICGAAKIPLDTCRIEQEDLGEGKRGAWQVKEVKPEELNAKK